MVAVLRLGYTAVVLCKQSSNLECQREPGAAEAKLPGACPRPQH